MYSQNEEEKYILEAIGEQVGIFLDIGAYDGVTRSNTLALVEREWCGVMVEPSPLVFNSLLIKHGENEKLKLVEALIGIKRKVVPFWPSQDGIGTSSQKHYERWKQSAKYEPKMYLPQITVEDLIDSFPYLKDTDVVSIDTEGTNSELFFNFPFDTVHPKVLCVEYEKSSESIEVFASKLGYSLTYKSSENMVLVCSGK